MLYRMTKITYDYHMRRILAFEQTIDLGLALSSLTNLRVHCGERLTGVKASLDFRLVIEQADCS